MIPTVEFRAATADDWPAIWPVCTEFVAGGDTYTYPPGIGEHDARLEWMHVHEPRTVTFVALLDGDVVGTALRKPVAVGLGDHVANAGWMIAPANAGRVIGRRFAAHVSSAARKLGFTAMQFDAVVAGNERARHLWRSLGFDEVGGIPGAFRHAQHGPTDLIIMFREL